MARKKNTLWQKIKSFLGVKMKPLPIIFYRASRMVWSYLYTHYGVWDPNVASEKVKDFTKYLLQDENAYLWYHRELHNIDKFRGELYTLNYDASFASKRMQGLMREFCRKNI